MHRPRNLYFTGSNWAITPPKQPKTFCCTKGESAADHNKITRPFKRFHLGRKNLANQARSGRTKTVDSKTVFQAKLRYYPSESITQRESGKLSISQFSVVVHHLHSLIKSIQGSWIVPHILPKCCRTLDSPKYLLAQSVGAVEYTKCISAQV